MSDLHLLPISARTPAALEASAGAFRDHLATRGDLRVDDICYTAAVRRTHHEYRLVVAGHDRHALATNLDSFTRGEPNEQVLVGPRIRGSGPRVACYYPARAASWWMGFEAIAERYPVFGEALDRWELAVRRRLREPSAADGEVRAVALELAFTELWRWWGVRPQSFAGQGVGELAAELTSGSTSAGLPSRGPSVVLEIAPEETPIAPPGGQGPSAAADVVVSAFSPDRDREVAILLAVARLHVLGVGIDWKHVLSRGGAAVPLPTYPWQRSRYWWDDPLAYDVAGSKEQSRDGETMRT